jgi:prevent-host-death family protein
MRTVNIHEAKTHLSRLIERAASGEPFIIAKAGRPLVKVMPIDAPERGAERRLGFLAGQADVPIDFDRMGAAEIGRMFEGDV